MATPSSSPSRAPRTPSRRRSPLSARSPPILGRPHLRVRIGIHTADPEVGADRYVGLGVHRAARICAAAHGGQIVVSNATRELIEDDLTESVELGDLGAFELKDLERPERIYQVRAPGLPGRLSAAAHLVGRRRRDGVRRTRG